MGSKKQVENTGAIEQGMPPSLFDPCHQMRCQLNILEDLLAGDFSDVNGETSVAHSVLQEALGGYFHALTEAIVKKDLATGKVISSEQDSVSLLAPNFVRYLSRFGKVGFSYLPVNETELRKVGVFLRRDEDLFLGSLELLRNPLEIRYMGYIPIGVSEEEFHRPLVSNALEGESPSSSVYHLSGFNIPGLNSAFVRLFCETINGQTSRVDGYGARGIEFP